MCIRHKYKTSTIIKSLMFNANSIRTKHKYAPHYGVYTNWSGVYTDVVNHKNKDTANYETEIIDYFDFFRIDFL